MIDFDRFWAEPGCLPGLGKEQSDEYMQEMLDAIAPQVAEFAQIDLPSEGLRLDPESRPGVVAKESDAWERKQGVRLPDVLRQALARQNGGYVRGHAFNVLPLEQMARPEEDGFWEFATFEEEDVPDRQLIVRFAEDEDLGGSFFLNYNAHGQHGEPSVMEYHSDAGDMNQVSDSVTKFFERMLKTSDAPSVDWSETANGEVLARETIDLTSHYRKSAQREQVLTRQGSALVVYCRDTNPEGVRLTKTTLPEPLESDSFTNSILHRSNLGLHELYLQPRDTEGIVHLESKQTGEGRWKNYITRGAPVMAMFWSRDRGRLENLLRTLFGDKAAKHAQAQDRSRDAFLQKMWALSPDDQQAAGLAMFQQLKERLFPGGPPSAANMPPEAAALQKLLNEKMREIDKRAQERLDQHPLNPEIRKLLGELIDPPSEEK